MSIRNSRILLCYMCLHLAVRVSLCFGQITFQPPPSSAEIVKGVPFASAKPVGAQFQKHFSECDQHDTCDGARLTHGCSKDQNRNTAILSLPGGAIFYNAKMGIDADGSPLSMKNAGPTDQPVTKFRYKLPGAPSVNSDAVPYIVIPLGDFRTSLNLAIGDVAAVVFKDHIVYALVADLGPKCKLGEGSIALHEQLGHHVCSARDADGNCTKLHDVGLEKDVLYFVFPGSAKTIAEGLTPDNVVERLKTQGPILFDALRAAPAKP